MEGLSAIEVLAAAKSSPHGLAFATSSVRAARQLRRALYAARDAARRQGHTVYDGLSMIVRCENSCSSELWVLHRRARVQPRPLVNSGRPLERHELPELVRVRGRRRPSLLGQAFLAGAFLEGLGLTNATPIAPETKG